MEATTKVRRAVRSTRRKTKRERRRRENRRPKGEKAENIGRVPVEVHVERYLILERQSGRLFEYELGPRMIPWEIYLRLFYLLLSAFLASRRIDRPFHVA